MPSVGRLLFNHKVNLLKASDASLDSGRNCDVIGWVGWIGWMKTDLGMFSSELRSMKGFKKLGWEQTPKGST